MKCYVLVLQVILHACDYDLIDPTENWHNLGCLKNGTLAQLNRTLVVYYIRKNIQRVVVGQEVSSSVQVQTSIILIF